MPSTTTNKKEIVDFLWEWADNHDQWGKLLISKIVATESSLTSDDREIVFDYFLQSIKLVDNLPPIDLAKPSYTPNTKEIELVSLSNVTGVNKLAKNQVLNFGKNLTVIYGENGTGKTGYGRILKTLGFSYEISNVIHSNIFREEEAKSALIKFRANAIDKEFNWNGSNRDPDLESISVFNNNCVQISLSDRHLIVSPIGFHLFGLVIAELKELETLLQAKISAYPTSIRWFGELKPGTPQQLFISELSSVSKEDTLIELSNYTPENEQQLAENENALLNLNRALLQTEANNLATQKTELDSIVAKIKTTQNVLSSTNWQLIIEYNKKIADLESKTQKGIKELAEEKGIELYQTKEFQSFIVAAEGYIKLLNKVEYPTENDLCVYCKQPLEKSSNYLLKSYRLLLNDKTQENLRSIKDQKEKLIQQVSKVDTNLVLHHPSFGVDQEQKPIQPIEILNYQKELGTSKATFLTGNVNSESTFDYDYTKLITLIEARIAVIKASMEQKNSVLINITTKENELKRAISELQDRKLLSSKVDEVKKVISNHAIIVTLNKAWSSFNSKSISAKTSQARDELVNSNFNQIFENELKAFRKSHIKIELSFGTSKGSSRVSQKINHHLLTEILSEGEQKSIALAEFLTEIQLDNSKAPVIFDDPVNSLDHHIIDDVARRLLRLSKDRQVVIFTHSVLLFNSILYFSKQPTYKGEQYKFYNTRNEFEECGIISEAEEEINKVNAYLSKINLLINNTPKGRPEADLAEDGYGLLRSAIELCVEHEIFQGTVKRYQKNIALTSFSKVDGVKLNMHKDKLNEIFERCCGYIKGHSNPIEIHNSPTLEELKNDLAAFKTVRDAFGSN